MSAPRLELLDGGFEMWSDALRCYFFGWRAAGERHLVLDLPLSNVPDMRGAIATARALCPKVERISCLHKGGARDTEYVFDGERWRAFRKSEVVA